MLSRLRSLVSNRSAPPPDDGWTATEGADGSTWLHRRGADIPDGRPDAETNEDDPTVHRPYTPREEYQFRSSRSSRYRGDDAHYHHMGRGGTLWERAEDLATMEPITPATLDPAVGDMVQVSEMAGFGAGEDRGFDAMQGVAGMVTGEVDSGRFLSAPSATPGGPLRMGPGESVFSDDLGFGDSGPGYGPGPEDAVSDTAELTLWEPEMEETYGRGAQSAPEDFDWCGEL